MKIGIDIRMAGTQHGGIGRYVLELVKNIFLIDQENEYYLFYNDDQSADISNLKSSISNLVSIKTNIRHYSVKEQLWFPRILNKYNLDLMHFTNFNVPIFYKRPFVVTIHDLIHHRLGGVKKTNLLHYWAYKKVIESAVKNAAKIITVSKASRDDIISEFGIPAERMAVVYEGVSLYCEKNEKQIAQVRQKYFLNKPYFIFVGSLQRNKNILGLCKGFGVFLKKYGHNFDLVIAGKVDPHYPDIKNECLAMSGSENLVFTGPVDDEDLSALYQGAYAFVSASLFEGFGLPGAEAMGFGLPLAVSNIPVFNEVYENGAIYFDPHNPENIAQCLNLLAQDRLYYMQIRAKALQRAKVFSWEKCAREALEIYNQILTS